MYERFLGEGDTATCAPLPDRGLDDGNIVRLPDHPSGDPSPSPEDVRVTREIVNAGKLLSIDLLDHLIIGHNQYTSLKEKKLGFD
jgi:hypothetical protein